MSSNLRASLPSVTLIFSLPRASVAVRVSQLHRGGRRVHGGPGSPHSCCGGSTSLWLTGLAHAWDPGPRSKGEASFTTSPPCSADLIALVGLDLTVSLMSRLFSVPHHVFPEKGDLVSSVSPHLSLEQLLEHRFQLEGEMSAEMAQHPSALSQMQTLLTHLTLCCLDCLNDLCLCIYTHTAGSTTEGFLLKGWMTVSSCFYLSLTFSLAILN